MLHPHEAYAYQAAQNIDLHQPDTRHSDLYHPPPHSPPTPYTMVHIHPLLLPNLPFYSC